MKQAVYPGSFDPITNGHVDIIQRAISVFDHIKIVVLTNVDKAYQFNKAERIKMISDVFCENEKITVDFYSGLSISWRPKLIFRSNLVKSFCIFEIISCSSLKISSAY